MNLWMPDRRWHFHLGARCVFVYLEPRDLWVGAFVAPSWIYICPLPCLVIKVER